jgi:predicted SAM-dependent methyltransferase
MLNKLFGLGLAVVPRPLLIRLSLFAQPLLKVLFKGNKYTDPIDRRSFRKFLPYGYRTQRQNVLSPSTLSLERHRLLWLYLERHSSFLKEAPAKSVKLLHVAPEQCFHERFSKLPHVEVTTFDQNSPLAQVKGDLRALPFEDGVFDVVFCNHVLEHISEDLSAMKELYRILKPGGWGIVQVPMKADLLETYEDHSVTTAAERQKHFGQYDHVRWYGRKDYFRRLEQAGFVTEALRVSELFTAEEIERFVLDIHEILPIIRR